MIRHRFIVRGADDFRIFAAIPVETKVLTWEKWVRPPDWEAFEKIMNDIIVPAYTCVLDKLKLMREMIAEASESLVFQRVVEDGGIDRDAFCARSETAAVFQEHFESILLRLQTRSYVDGDFREVCLNALASFDSGGIQQFRDGREGFLRCAKYGADWAEFYTAHKRDVEAKCAAHIWGAYDCGAHIGRDMEETAAWTRTAVTPLLSSDPLPDTPCPPGVPFAAYTVEFKDAVFNVVEGKAWLQEPLKKTEEEVKRNIESVLDKLPKEEQRRALEHVRDALPTMPPSPSTLVREPTDAEKRVVEIVTQMLVNRRHNPKAPERIPVMEVDPGHANHVWEAEARDQQAGRAPKVRTIKFNVTPPRYLREAVERISASPGKHKKAHWVGGHWRNQPCGPGHKERREKWIKPHIRGLGEAGAVVVRVAAADETVATLPDQPVGHDPDGAPL